MDPLSNTRDHLIKTTDQWASIIFVAMQVALVLEAGKMCRHKDLSDSGIYVDVTLACSQILNIVKDQLHPIITSVLITPLHANKSSQTHKLKQTNKQTKTSCFSKFKEIYGLCIFLFCVLSS